MNDKQRCPTCGGELPKAGAECPACLMNLALEAAVRAEASEEVSAGTREAEADLGSSIGPYKLTEILGQGGMGVVYRATQTEPIQRDVALKLIKIGMDSTEVLGRFELERRTLALMDHPNIARVIDAGATERGRPFFVMEYVPGLSVTDYCDEKKLPVRARIDLFLSICDAVQHAHLKGIIHRDLKPSNVLVTERDGRAVPKVIDFGLAKATQQRLAERTAFTRFGRLIGTPEYMSPEQAGLTDAEVDSRTDLYSLGILLYEMLAGAPPLDSVRLREAGLEGLLRQIRETPSPRPSVRVSSLGEAGIEIARNRQTDRSTLMRRLQGDLDWVVMKAIEKDRSRRYATVQELAAELRRYLNQEPVEAGPPGAVYRVGKFVRRHRIGVAAAAAVAIALLLGVAGTSVGWRRAVRAERRAVEAEGQARQEAETAKQVSNFLEGLFLDSEPTTEPADSITAPEILARGTERIRDELAGQPLLQARMMLTVARVYRSLAMYEEAQALAEEALRIRERELPPGHLDVSYSLHQLGMILIDRGRLDEAEAAIQRAMETQDRILEPDHPLRVPIMTNLVGLYNSQGRFREAEPLARKLLEIHEQGTDPALVAQGQRDLGTTLWAQGRYDEAEPLLVQAFETLRPLGEHVTIASLANQIAVVYQRQGRHEESREMMKLVIEIQERIYGPDHPRLADSLQNLGTSYAIQGYYAEAEPLFMRALQITEDSLGPDHPALATTLVNVANIQRDRGRYAEAETTYHRAIERLERTLGPEHPSLATACGNLAGLYARQGRDQEAEALHRQALAIREKALGPEHPDTAYSLDNVAASLRDRGLLDEAEPLLLRALAIREKAFDPDHALVARSLHELAMLYREQGRDPEAIEYFERAIRIREKALGPNHPKLASSLNELAILHRDRGRPEEAEPLFRRAIGIMEAKYETDHPQIREMLVAYAALLRQAGRVNEAEPLEARARALEDS